MPPPVPPAVGSRRRTRIGRRPQRQRSLRCQFRRPGACRLAAVLRRSRRSVQPDRPRTPGRRPDRNKVIQLYDAYLVVETAEGMLVIDQHALHERILFEQLKRASATGPLETQRLLIPEPVELPAEQAARTLEHREALAELGLGVEDFGGGTVLLTSYPALLGRRSPQAILQAVVDHLTAKDRPPTREVLFNDLLSLMACHAAVRAGDRLTPEEIAALVEQRTWPTTRTTARTAGRRRCCSAGTTWTGSSGESNKP